MILKKKEDDALTLGPTYIIKTRRLTKRRPQLISSFVKLQLQSRSFTRGGSDYQKRLVLSNNIEGRHFYY
jgi:hypothetical protein